MPEKEQRIGKASEALRYPKDLVDRFGAKAGILMYIARELPDIPQAPMVVSEIGEPSEDLLRRADQAGIGWPRLFRSSAVAELDGYEGDFRTEEVDTFEDWSYENRFRRLPRGSSLRDEFDDDVRSAIERVKKSSLLLKNQGKGYHLPDEINVIVAERSQSKYVGTYIKHPNREGTFLVSLTEEDPYTLSKLRQDFVYSTDSGLSLLNESDEWSFGITPDIESDIKTATSWHDRITDLPDMDQRWAYQVEFGTGNPCLYQVRPFRLIEKAKFAIESPDKFPQSVVIGVTPPEGIVARVIEYPIVGHRDLSNLNPDNLPVIFNGPLKQAWESDKLNNVQVACLRHWRGLLEHGSVKVIRRTPVTILSYHGLFTDGEEVRVTSDGVNFKIEEV
jgi:hypothetical protein